MRRKIASILSVTLISSFLTIFFGIEVAHAVSCGTATGSGVTSNNITILPTHGSTFYIDTGITPKLDAAFSGYTISNSGTTKNVWVELKSFTGGQVSLADTPVHELPALVNGTPQTAFFLLKASGTTTATDQVHTVTVYDGDPNRGGNSLVTCDFTFTSIAETIKASANKVQSVTVPSNNPSLGSLVTVVAKGTTGTVGNGDNRGDNDIIWVSPAGFSTWPTTALRLESTSITLDVDGNWSTTTDECTYTNKLIITGASNLTCPTAKLGSASQYQGTYNFRVIGSSTTTFKVAPVAQISSGANYKHSDTASTAAGAFPTIDLTGVTSPMTVDKQIAPKGLVTNKSQSGTIATLTTSAAHGLSAGDVVYVMGVGAPFDGKFTLATASGSTLTYTVASGTVASTSVSNAYLFAKAPNLSATGTSSGTTRTLTVSSTSNLKVGMSFTVPAGNATYAGTYTIATIPSATTFTYTGTTSSTGTLSSTSITFNYAVVPYRAKVNSSSSSSTNVDEIVDIPTTGMYFFPGSASYTDSSHASSTTLSDPVTDSTETNGALHYAGPFSVTSSTSAILDYKMYVPDNIDATYGNELTAKVGTTAVKASATANPKINITSTTSGVTGTSVTTTQAPATATTTLPTTFSATTATLAGVVNPSGNSVTITFKYATTSAGVASASAINATPNTSTSTSNLSVSTDISGLTANTTYYYQVYATYGSTTISGGIQSFTTNQIGNTSQTITWGTSNATYDIGSTTSLVQNSLETTAGNGIYSKNTSNIYTSSGLLVVVTTSNSSICTVTQSDHLAVDGITVDGQNFTINFLSTGTCTVYANQPGDPTYAAATQVSKTFTLVQNSYTFTGPTTGTVNSASSNFTITPASAPLSSTVVTVALSGSGKGSLSNPSKTFTTATAQTFTITPTYIGTINLTPSASPAMGTDPALIVYTSTGSYTLTGPASGNINTASTNFTLTPNGVVGDATTVTLTFSGTAKGTLSTQTVNFPAGSSSAVTFTVTPNASGTLTITPTTNNSLLTNPSAINYTVNGVNFTIAYAAGGGSGSAPTSPTSVASGGTFTTPSNTYTKSGYSFSNWNDGTNNYNENVTYPSSGSVLSNVTLTAQWTGNQYVYSANTGSGSAPSSQTYAGSTLTANANTFTPPTGYSFGGWCLTQPAVGSSCSGTTYAATNNLPNPASSTSYLYAVWSANALAITYASGGGTGSAPTSPTSVNYGSTFTTPTNTYTRTGYTFSNWNDGTNNYNASVTYPSSGTATVAVTLTAQWTGNQYVYNGNTATGTTASQTYAGSDLTARANGFNVPSGYTFGGWCLTQPAVGDTCSGTTYAESTGVLPTPGSATTSIYAIWIGDPTATTNTLASGDFTATSIVLHGKGNAKNNANTPLGFYKYGTSSDLSGTTASTTAKSAKTNSANTDVDLQDETISSGINASTIYYYQAGVTAGGKTKYGQIKSILTLPTTPTNPVLTLDGTTGSLTFDSQTKGSNVIITYSISCTSTDGGSTVTASSTSNTVALTGFTAGATYTCSVNATSSAGISIDQGGGSSSNANASAKTVNAAPVATTDNPGAIDSTSVVLKGRAHPHGNNGGTGQFVFGTSSTLASGNSNYPSTAQTFTDGTNTDSTISDQTVTGLTPATVYYYKATAGATHQSTSSGSIHAVLTLPGAPTLNTLTITGTSASLDFTPVTAGSGVSILYTGACTPDGGGASITATGSSSPLSISGLASGTNYSCVVYATSSYTSAPSNNHGGGNGNNSGAKTGATAVSTDPEGITDDPTSITDTKFTMNGRAHGHGNTNSFGYFEWGTNSSLSGATSTSIQTIPDNTSTTLSTVDVTANPSTIYYYRTVGSNTTKTNRGVIHTVLTKPSQPTSVTLTLDGTTGTVSFPTETPGSGVTVTYYVSCTATGGATVTASGTVFSYVITGFTPGLTYTCTVYGSSAATDPTVVAFGGGNGSSNSGNGTVKAAPVANTDNPGAIDTTSVVLKGRAHPHGNNGGTGQFKFGTDSTLSSGTSNYPSSAQSYSNGTDSDSTIPDQTVSGLDSATIYYYQAVAGATNHTSSRGAIHAILTMPSAPTGLNSTVSGTSVTISFNAVSAGAGVSITYTAECTAGGVTTTSTATSLTSITISGLSPATTYSCVVYATASYSSTPSNSHGGGNSSNSSAASAVIAATTDPAAITDAPTSISATSFTMNGKADSGSEVSGTGNYEWSTISDLDSTTPTSAGSDSISTTQSPLSGTAVSASSATIYYYRAIGNAGGKKGKGATKSVLTLPAAPTSVNLDLNGTNGTLTFTAPTAGSNVELTYSISCTSSDGGTTVTSSGSTTTYNLTGFTPGKTYVCSVTPSSAASGVTVNYGGGNGNPGSHSGKSVKAAPVATTDAPNESDITSTSFKISGHAHPHGNNGGTGQLTWSTADDLSISPTNVPSSAQSYTDGTDSDSSISTQTVNSLTPATIYYYRANAGATNQSTSHGAIHAILTKPATPTGLNATVSGTSITVSFTGSTPGTNVSISYTLSCTPSGGGSATTATGSASPLTVTGLTAGTTYNCVVYATASYITPPSNQHGGGNGSSSSAASASISATTDPTGVTDDPTLITAESFTMNGQADSGTDATGDGNYEFDTDSTFGTSVDKGPKSITSTRSALDATSVTGLTSATIYYYRAVGKSGAKRGNGVTRAVLLLPSAPTLNSISISGTTASASFTTVSGGTNVTISYTVTCTPTGGGTAVTATGTTSPISVSGLASGTTYDCNVYATSAYLSAPSNSHGGGNSSRSGNQSGTTGSSSSPRRTPPSTPTTTPTPPVTPTTPTTPLIPNIPGPQGSGNQLTTANQGLVPNTNVAVVQTFANTYPAGINVTVPVLQVITAPIPPVEKVTQVIVNGNSNDPVFVNGGVKINEIIGPKDKVILQVTDGATIKEIPVAYTARPISLANVNFNLGSARLTSKAKKILDTVVKVMIEHGFTYLDLSGHTDIQGGATYDNKKLSVNRSAAVKAYLEKKLGTTVQVVTSAHSYTEPAVKGNTIAAHATNRRVQVVVK